MLRPTRKDTRIYASLAFAPLGFTMIALGLLQSNTGGSRRFHEYFLVLAVASATIYTLLTPALLLGALFHGISRILPVPIRQELSLTALRADDVLFARIRPPLAWIGAAAALVGIHATFMLLPTAALDAHGLAKGLSMAAWCCLLGAAALFAGAIATEYATRRSSPGPARALAAVLLLATYAVWGAILWAYMRTDRRGPNSLAPLPLVAATGAWFVLAARIRFARAADALYRFEPDPDAPPPAPRHFLPGADIRDSTWTSGLARDLGWLGAWVGAAALGSMIGLALDCLYRELSPAFLALRLAPTSPHALRYHFDLSDAAFPVLAGVLIGLLQSRTLAWRGWAIRRWAAMVGPALGAAVAWTRFSIWVNRRVPGLPRPPITSLERLRETAESAILATLLFVALAWFFARATAAPRKPLLALGPAVALAAFVLFHAIGANPAFGGYATMSQRSGEVRAYLLGLLVFGVASGVGILLLERIERARGSRGE